MWREAIQFSTTNTVLWQCLKSKHVFFWSSVQLGEPCLSPKFVKELTIFETAVSIGESQDCFAFTFVDTLIGEMLGSCGFFGLWDNLFWIANLADPLSGGNMVFCSCDCTRVPGFFLQGVPGHTALLHSFDLSFFGITYFGATGTSSREQILSQIGFLHHKLEMFLPVRASRRLEDSPNDMQYTRPFVTCSIPA